MTRRVLAVRQDNNGDVILIGPALRAISSKADVDLLCGPRGAAAGALLPRVGHVLVWEAAWIDAEPHPVRRETIDDFVGFMAGRYDEAIIFTSFHQSPLPMALLLRMAGIARIGAISVDYPGSLLDVRHRVEDELHEVERALSLANAMGYELPANDDRRLALRALPRSPFDAREYVVVHPGCTMPARTWSAQGFHDTVAALGDAGYRIAITGSRDETRLCSFVASAHENATNFGGRTDFAEYAALVAGASAVICGNTATTHVAAATGTPVIEIFPPTISFVRFAPWMVPFEVFGDRDIACAGCRARTCPHAGHPCLRNVNPQALLAAVSRIARVAEYAS